MYYLFSPAGLMTLLDMCGVNLTHSAREYWEYAKGTKIPMAECMVESNEMILNLDGQRVEFTYFGPDNIFGEHVVAHFIRQGSSDKARTRVREYVMLTLKALQLPVPNTEMY